eukprot:TRINITY_DN1454_c0_g1_i1.p1 TRINITY_DN1454_c0_g1~~TRINITY_DN1454_c0_g1_i1.p1  ORF type:complete len:755 (-),score=154.98 TRINITY_DN1454_c0_g1_i1:161-2425(-)
MTEPQVPETPPPCRPSPYMPPPDTPPPDIPLPDTHSPGFVLLRSLEAPASPQETAEKSMSASVGSGKRTRTVNSLGEYKKEGTHHQRRITSPLKLHADTPGKAVSQTELARIYDEEEGEDAVDKAAQRQKEYLNLIKRQEKYFNADQLEPLWPIIKDYHFFLILVRLDEASSNNLITDIIKLITEQKLEILMISTPPGQFSELLGSFRKNKVDMNHFNTRICILDVNPIENDRDQRINIITEISNASSRLHGVPLQIFAPFLEDIDNQKWSKNCTTNISVVKGFGQCNAIYWLGQEPQDEIKEFCKDNGTPIIKTMNYIKSYYPTHKELFNRNPNFRFVINFSKPEDGAQVEKMLDHLRNTCGFQSPVLIFSGQGCEISDQLYEKYDRVWVTGRPDVLKGYTRMFFLQWAPDLRMGDALSGKTTWEGTVTVIDIIARNLVAQSSKGASSPHVEILINGKKKQKTEAIPNNPSPRWTNLNWSFPCSGADDITFEVYHKKKEEGKIQIRILDVLKLVSSESPFLTKTWPLKAIKKVSDVTGTLTLTMTFTPTTMNAKKNQHFGVPLKESIQNSRAKNQPHITEAILDELMARALDLEGIARIPGDSMNVDRIINIVDSGMLSFSLSREDPFVLMGVLKKYIEMLPGRLFSQETYQKIFNLDLTVADVPLVKSLLETEEPERRKLCSDMFYLCKAITLHSKQNRMDTRAISTAIPIFVVPAAIQKDPFQYMLAMPKVPYIISFFIENGHLIWDWSDK